MSKVSRIAQRRSPKSTKSPKHSRCPICNHIVKLDSQCSPFDVLVVDYGLIELSAHLRLKHQVEVRVSDLRAVAKKRKSITRFVVDVATKQAFEPSEPANDEERVILRASESRSQNGYFMIVLECIVDAEVRDIMLDSPATRVTKLVIGTREDPDARHGETWQRSVGARRFKSLLRALDEPIDTSAGSWTTSTGQVSFDELLKRLAGRRFRSRVLREQF